MLLMPQNDEKCNSKEKHLKNPIRKIRCGERRVNWLSADSEIQLQEAWAVLHKQDSDYAKSMKSLPRQNEFLRSRWLMAELGLLPDNSPTRSADGIPGFRQKYVGSISHKSGHVVCIAEQNSLLKSIGIDLEDVSRLHGGLAEKICTTREMALLTAAHPDKGDDWTRTLAVIFSWKESLFKAHYPLGRVMFYFHDAELLELPDMKISGGAVFGNVLVDTSPATPKGSGVTGDFIFVDENGSIVENGRYALTVVATPNDVAYP